MHQGMSSLLTRTAWMGHRFVEWCLPRDFHLLMISERKKKHDMDIFSRWCLHIRFLQMQAVFAGQGDQSVCYRIFKQSEFDVFLYIPEDPKQALFSRWHWKQPDTSLRDMALSVLERILYLQEYLLPQTDKALQGPAVRLIKRVSNLLPWATKKSDLSHG